MAFRYPGNYNGFIPSFEASGQVISYTRDPSKFRLNQYAQYIPSKKSIGVYAYLDPDQAARVVNDDDNIWPEGLEAPEGNDNLQGFEFLDYRCKRRAYSYTLGDETIEDSDWKVLAAHAGMAAQQCMTARTLEVQKICQTAANWSGNTADANALNGGAGGWLKASDDESSPFYLAIKRSLLEALRRIELATNGNVSDEELMLVISPGLALAMSETAEIHDFVRGSPDALDQVRGRKPGQNTKYGLPDYLYGLKVIVENAVRVSTRPGTTATRNFVWQDSSAMICSRVGGLQGSYGVPSYSTVQLYFRREMEVQSFDDRRNERTLGRIVESRAGVLAAPAAGYLITNTNT